VDSAHRGTLVPPLLADENAPGVAPPRDDARVEPPRDANGFLTPEAVRGLFDRAVVHFNARRFFESHEDWETLWNDADGARREWLQGLIQTAAALHHVAHTGSASGFSKLVRSARAKAAGYAGDTEGIDFPAFWAQVEPWVEHGRRVEAGADLRRDVPPWPQIRYRPGVVPAPYPLEPEDAEASS
jgi:hypothetical protein